MKRRARAAFVVLTAVAAGGCEPDAIRARQAAIDPLILWRVEALNGEGAGQSAQVCADAMVRRGFDLPLPAVNGQACVLEDEPVQNDGYVAARCEIGGRRYGVTAATQGDVARSFTVDASIRAIGTRDGGYRQVRRYTRLGGCPEGWRVGETRDRDGTRRTDALTRR